MKLLLFPIFTLAALTASVGIAAEPAAALTKSEPASPAPGRARGRTSESPGRAVIDANSRSYMLVVSEFVTSREIMDEALSGKNAYEVLRFAVKAGKAEVKNYAGSGVVDDGARRTIQSSTQLPVVAGTSRAADGRTNSSVSYKNLGVSIEFSMGKTDDASAVANVSYRSSGELPGVTIDGVVQSTSFNFQGEGALKIESGIPSLLSAGEVVGDESHRPRAVFVRADW